MYVTMYVTMYATMYAIKIYIHKDRCSMINSRKIKGSKRLHALSRMHVSVCARMCMCVCARVNVIHSLFAFIFGWHKWVIPHAHAWKAI